MQKRKKSLRQPGSPLSLARLQLSLRQAGRRRSEQQVVVRRIEKACGACSTELLQFQMFDKERVGLSLRLDLNSVKQPREGRPLPWL